MNIAHTRISGKTHALPQLAFEEQRLTSFGGAVVFHPLFQRIKLLERLQACCRHLAGHAAYGGGRVLRVLVLHLLLGYRQLRELDCYRDDPLVKHLLGLRLMPSVPTLSRALNAFDAASVVKTTDLNRTLCLDRLGLLNPARVTLDFDGSVLGTKRHAEGTAVGYCKKKKGLRSYYPLFCTLAQTGQALDMLHRPGNVHDSNGALEFIAECIHAVRLVVPDAQIEVRMDSAFFDDPLIALLEGLGVEYTLSVPFQRFTELKTFIERRTFWWPMGGALAYFERSWKPKAWTTQRRFLFIRKGVPLQQKAPIQLDLFEPRQFGFEFKVVLTNKTNSARKVVRFHEGRGAQEGVFAQLKDQTQMDYVPVRSLAGNQIYLLCTLLAHNLGRELQMQTDPGARGTTEKRSPLWIFKSLRTLQNTLIRCAGRLTRPQGKLTLTMNANPTVQRDLLHYLAA